MSKSEKLEQNHPSGQWISGYFIEGGVLLGLDFTEQRKSKYASQASADGIYIPPFISKISIEDDSFNLMGDIVDEWVMTDSVKYFDDSNFYMCGFKRFAILDQNTGAILFDTNRFIDPNQNNFLGDIPAFIRFSTKLNKDPEKFYNTCRKSAKSGESNTDSTIKKASKPENSVTDNIYRHISDIKCERISPLSREYGGILKKKIKITDEVTDRVYTVSYTTQSKKNTLGSKHYDLYDAFNHYLGGSQRDILIDVSKAKDIPFSQRTGRQTLWENILVSVSEDDVLKDILALAPKNASGSLTKNRIVRIACDGIVTEYGEIMQLIAKAKDETTLEVFQKSRQFSPDELQKIEEDYFSKHPELIKKP